MNARVARLAARLRPHAPEIAISLAAIGGAWTFAAVVLQHTRPFGLPLEDAYIYLTYAKQFGRGEPFTYFHGGGYSAGSTAALGAVVRPGGAALRAGSARRVLAGGVPGARRWYGCRSGCARRSTRRRPSRATGWCAGSL